MVMLLFAVLQCTIYKLRIQMLLLSRLEMFAVGVVAVVDLGVVVVHVDADMLVVLCWLLMLLLLSV